jgi:hypothetical protein
MRLLDLPNAIVSNFFCDKALSRESCWNTHGRPGNHKHA